MITKAMVEVALRRWQDAGLVPPSTLGRMAEEFINRFRFMDEEALKYVTERLMLSNVWPTFNVIAQAAEEYREQDNQYVYIDYFGELEKNAYKENESFEEFVERIGKKYFPNRDEEWRTKHAFTLSFFGVRMQACKDCKGTCPHNGHQYGLRIKRGTSILIPFASMDLCSKYKQTMDKEGRIHKEVQQENWTMAGVEAFQSQEEPDEDIFFYTNKPTVKRVQIEQPSLGF